jgi:hypothetical protein
MSDTSGNSSVSDYLKNQQDVYLKQLRGSRPAPATSTGLPNLPGPPEPEVGFLGGVIDFLSRPLYAVTNIADKALDLPERFAEGEGAQGVGALLASPFTGFFAQDRENKNYTSDIIEKNSDVFNKNTPGYVDVENNVDPLIKGTLGFAGDLVLDPLMWIPGAQIAKGLNLGAQAVRKGLGVTQSIARTVSGAKAADEAVGAVVGAERSNKTPVTNLGDIAEAMDNPAQGGFKITQMIKQAVRKGDLPSDAVSSALRSTVNDAKVFKTKSRRNQIDTLLKTWQSGRLADDLPVTDSVLDFGSWRARLETLSDGAKATVKIPAKIAGLNLRAGNLKALSDKVKAMSPEDAAAFINNNAGTIEELVYRPLYDSYRAGMQATGRADLLGRTARVISPSEAAEGVVARLSTLIGTELANAEQIMTPGLLNSLRKLNPEGMARFLDNSQNVLNGKGIVEGMGRISGRSAERNLLKALEVTREEYDAAVGDLLERINKLIAVGPAVPLNEAVENLVADAGFMAELTTRMRDIGFANPGLINDAAQVIQDALVKTFKSQFDPEDLKARGYKPTIRKNGEIYVTDEELGAGVARIMNSYNTGAQSAFYTELAQGFGLLFKGVFVRDAAGNPVFNMVGGRRVYEYVQLPKYVKAGPGDAAYNAFKGFDLAAVTERATIAALKTAEDFVMSKGIPLVIDITPKGKGAKRVVETLRFSDIYENLRIGFKQLSDTGAMSAVSAERTLQLLLFNGDTGMSRSHLADAVIALMNGASKSELLAIVRSDTTRYGKKLDKGANWLSGKKENKFGFFPTGTPFPKDVRGLKAEELFDEKNRSKGFYGVWDNGVAAENLVDALLASRTAFENVAQIRKQQYLARSIEEFGFFSPQIAQNLIRLFSDETATLNALQAVDNLGSIVIDYAKALDATELSAVYAAGAIRNVIPSTVHSAAKFANDFTEAIARGDEVWALRKQASDTNLDDLNKIYDDGLRAVDDINANPGAYDDATRQMADDVTRIAADTPEPRHNGHAQILLGLSKILKPLDAKWGMDVRNHAKVWLEFESLGVAPYTYVARLKSLDNLRTKYANNGDILVLAMRELQLTIRTGLRTGKDVAELIAKQTNPVLREAMQDLYQETGKLFNVKGALPAKLKGAMNSPFGRAGLTPEQLNRFFVRSAILGKNGNVAKLPESGSFLDFNKVAQDMADTGADRLTATLNQWLDWDIENPLGFLTNTHSALYKMLTEVQFIDNFGAYALRENLGVATAAEAKKLGYVKLDSGSGTHFGHLLPDNLYVDENMAFIFKQMDDAMKPNEFYNTEFGKAITKYYDVILDRWKTTVTILRPGHHLRNMVGSLSLRFFALGAKYFGPSDLLSGRMLSRTNKYTDVDMIRASDQMTNSVPMDNEIVIRTPLGNMTARQLEDDITKYLFIEGRRAEDLFDDQILKGRYSENVDKFFQYVTLGAGKRGGIVEEKALDLSWYVQHRNIVAHYIQALRQASDATPKKPFVRGLTDTAVPKTLDEARALALESALKYHPTPNMLTAWEKVFPRRLFPFYTWLKLASVALVEASILNPARTLTTIPKASYNLAVAMGVDPYSMYHPFPTDQLFPQFLTDEMTGPQFEVDGKYIAVSPGFASLDIYNTFSNPIEGATQLLSPMLRIPLELLAGSRLGTQAPITDISDYIDSSIPGVNYIANISGRSVTGLGAPQAQVERGNKTVFDQSLSAFNWLTGAGVRNYTRPNYINFAEIEARNAAAEEAKVEENLINFLLGRLQ